MPRMADSLPLIVPGSFPDFALLDSGAGYRLEQWGPYRLARPDPQVIWERRLDENEWRMADATFIGAGDGGGWNLRTRVPGTWPVRYVLPACGKEVRLHARLTSFKHTGIFAEQAANWEWMEKLLHGGKCKVLNLFAYSGAASVILATAGHGVTHVDASKPAIGWAKQNQELSGLAPDSIRWILEDAGDFVRREVRRGQTYDAVVMDPPAFGHAPGGKTWKFNEHLPGLLTDCAQLLSSDAAFLLVNGYAVNSSALALGNLVDDVFAKRGGTVERGELCLRQKDGRMLSTGIWGRWER